MSLHSAMGMRAAWAIEKMIPGQRSMGRGIPPAGEGNSCVEFEAIMKREIKGERSNSDPTVLFLSRGSRYMVSFVRHRLWRQCGNSMRTFVKLFVPVISDSTGQKSYRRSEVHLL